MVKQSVTGCHINPEIKYLVNYIIHLILMKLAIRKEMRLLQYWSYTAPQKLDRKNLTFGVFYYEIEL